VVHRHWWSTFGLVIVLALIVLAGFLVCLVGMVVTVPVATASLMYVYEDLFGPEAQAVRNEISPSSDEGAR